MKRPRELSVLFWNLMGNQKTTWTTRSVNLQRSIDRLARKEDIDILLFAESGFASRDLLTPLNRDQPRKYFDVHPENERLQVISRLSETQIKPRYQSLDQRLLILRVEIESKTILLGVVHFQSQRQWNKESQFAEAIFKAQEIAQLEDTDRHQNTILVGDLNMDPFHPGLVTAHAFNAVMTRKIAEREERKVSEKSYRFFYNPMWGFFGDQSLGPAGTCYFSPKEPVWYYWNMFDQVLLRPSMMDLLRDLAILYSDSQESFLTSNATPNKTRFSDHLPILFRLRLFEGE